MLMGRREEKGVVSISKMWHWRIPWVSLAGPEISLLRFAYSPAQITTRSLNPGKLEGGTRCLGLASWMEVRFSSIGDLAKRGSARDLAKGKYKEETLRGSHTYGIPSPFLSIGLGLSLTWLQWEAGMNTPISIGKKRRLLTSSCLPKISTQSYRCGSGPTLGSAWLQSLCSWQLSGTWVCIPSRVMQTHRSQAE